MALKARENINGVTPQDLNKLNTNFQQIWKTLFGGIDFSSTNNDLKKRIQTQTIPVQGEGNFDKNFPLHIRFYVPSNVKTITSTSFNLICERYRMDSGVAMDGGSVVNAPIEMSLASANTGIASVSSPTVGVSSVSSSSTTSSSGGGTSAYVDLWGNWYPGDPVPSGDVVAINPSSYLFGRAIPDKQAVYNIIDIAPYGVSGVYKFAPVYKGYSETSSETEYWLDLASVQHKHEIPNHTHSIPSHSHTITMQPHTHSITLQPHTHEASAKLNIPAHKHDLNEGIQISKTDATGVTVKLNGTTITTMDSTANNTKNNLDITDKINIGAWNVIECSTLSLARITLYGIIELVMKY